MKRPASLAEVAARTSDVRTFFVNVAEFLDQFRLERVATMLTEEPSALAVLLGDQGVADAYLAAVAVSLAAEIGRGPPAWALSEHRKLRAPWFAHPGPALRATLLAESPAAFRERNLFVSENALSRA